MNTRRGIFATIGGLLGLLAVAVLVGGVWLLWLYGTHRNDDGFLTSRVAEVSTDGYALTSSEIEIAGISGDWIPSGWLATIELRATSGNSSPLFLGVGPSADVREYLRNVRHSEVSDLARSTVSYVVNEGSEEPSSPAAQTFWLETSQGEGAQRIAWDLQQGDWTMVIMNADGSPSVDVRASVGAASNWLIVAIVVLLVGGGVLAVLSTLFVVLAFRRRPPMTLAAPAAAKESSVPMALGGSDGGDSHP